MLAAVLAWFPGAAADRHTACLARALPGDRWPMHRDGQPPGWLTLVHVPLVTGPGAWHQFEGLERFRMEAGHAYAFDTRRRHAYGNDGPAQRIHLLFDVIAM